MKLGDDYPSSTTGSSRITYHFIPTAESNVLVVYFAFVAANVSHHTYQENPYFRIDMLDASNNLLLTPSTNSYFLVNPQGNSPAPNPAAQTTPWFTCGAGTGNERKWSNWRAIAFNLGNYVGQRVKLRVTTADCVYHAHYAYGYFTAQGFAGKIEATACPDSLVKLTVPRGFQHYTWYCNGVRIPDTDDQYTITRPRVITDTAYRCHLVAYTGAVMDFTATVDYYELDPQFEPVVATTTCEYDVQFNNNTRISIVRPDGVEVEEIANVEWDFGDGSPRSTEISPTHRYDATGDYNVTLTVWDRERKCSRKNDTIPVRVVEFVYCQGYDTVRLCTEQLPYTAYGQTFTAEGTYAINMTDYSGGTLTCANGCDSSLNLTILTDLPHCQGYDTVYVCKENFPYTHVSGNVFNTSGTYTVLYEDACPSGCDSTLYLRVVEVSPRVAVNIAGDFCDEFTAELYTETASDVASYLWNTGEMTDRITITEPGQYHVTITDAANCKADNFYKVPACLPNIVLATAISPSDQNGINDYFHLPQIALVESAEVMIYDRNGTLVFYSKDKNFQWGGTVNGKLAYNAVYNYILSVTDYNGITTRHTGALGVY
jgi:gliding motility-associated-like protein